LNRIVARQQSDVRSLLRRGLESLAYEIIPLSSAMDAVLRHVPQNIRLTVTASPSQGQDRTVELAEALAAHGYRVAPHLSAQQVQDRKHLTDIVARCRAAGITGVLVVGGDRTSTPTQFQDAHSLLEALHELDHPFTEIGVAGHPEGHPAVPDALMLQALARKAPLAHNITTQICFAPATIATWAQGLAARGVNLPIHVGLPGAVHRQKLLRISGRLGVGESARFLKKQQSLFWRFFLPGGYCPDTVMRGLGPSLARSDNHIKGFHIFTFNDLTATEVWRRQALGHLVEML
jgi:methylenetetrahydrofolate reductase (NADPH)